MFPLNKNCHRKSQHSTARSRVDLLDLALVWHPVAIGSHTLQGYFLSQVILKKVSNWFCSVIEMLEKEIPVSGIAGHGLTKMYLM